MLDLDEIGSRGDESPNLVLQLPDVARPVVIKKALHRPRCEFDRRTGDFVAKALVEAFYKQRDVGGATPQWWKRNRRDVESVVEVLSKRPR